MKKNDLLIKNDKVLRIIQIQESRFLVIDCVRFTMPVWVKAIDIADYAEYAEELYYQDMNFEVLEDEHIPIRDKSTMYQCYSMVIFFCLNILFLTQNFFLNQFVFLRFLS